MPAIPATVSNRWAVEVIIDYILSPLTGEPQDLLHLTLADKRRYLLPREGGRLELTRDNTFLIKYLWGNPIAEKFIENFQEVSMV